MRLAIFLSVTLHGILIFSQVGIGTNTPHASAQLELQSSAKGFLLTRMTTAQRVAITSPATGLQVYDNNTNSIWYFNGVFWVDTQAMASYGDVKSGIQSVDHSGWILLDGRLLTTLSASQQAIAASLGLSSNLPNAMDAFLVQNGGVLASVTGANTVTLTQSNLPNVSFSGTAAAAGTHSHTTDPSAFNSTSDGSHSHSTAGQNLSTSGYTHNHGVGDGSNAYNDVAQNIPGLVRRTNPGDPYTADGIDAIFSGDEPDLRYAPKAIPNDFHQHNVFVPGQTTSTESAHNHSIDVPSTTSTIAPDHTHNVTVSSGGVSAPVNITPKSLSVNMFIYLGF
jgi:hypothetical protein